MGLRFKYNAVLVLACVLGTGIALGLTYQLVRASALQEVEREISLMRANATAVRSYTLNHIDPLLSNDSAILFQPEAVTSFAARSVFATVSEDFPQYNYKEAALNPTNPADLPTALEADMIAQFRADPSIQNLSAVIEDDAGPLLAMAFPVTINSEGCLRCHSTPEAAPPAMVDLYGSENGFGWQMGETVGAQIITAPMALIQQRAWETGLIVVAALSATFALVVILTNIMLTRIVLRPVAYLSNMAEQVSLGDFAVPEYTPVSRDEISSLATSFNRMRRSLDSAMKMIDD